MSNTKSILILTLLFGSAPLMAADIYDILRGTQPGGNLSYNDVQGAAIAQQLSAQQQLASQAPPNPLAPVPPAGTPAFKPTTLRDEAFKELVNKTFPLLPKQIEELHRHHDDEQLAIHTPAYAPPQPVSSTLTVDLSPGATPPIVRLPIHLE